MPSTTIRKHWFGLFIILLCGLGFTALLTGLSLFLIGAEAAGQAPPFSSWVIGLLAVIVLLATAVSVIVYTASNIAYNDETVKFVNQISLFGNDVSQFEFRELQDVKVNRGLGGLLFGYGTLLVQTAGTQTHFKFTYTPKAQAVADKLLELSTGI